MDGILKQISFYFALMCSLAMWFSIVLTFIQNYNQSQFKTNHLTQGFGQEFESWSFTWAECFWVEWPARAKLLAANA